MRPPARGAGRGAGLEARKAALETLRGVLETGQPLEQAFAAAVGRLDGRDRAFVRAMVSTCLRRLGQIDDALSRWLDKPLRGLPPPTLLALRLGATQILFLRTPAFAAVSSMLEVADRTPALRRHKGLLNAVLRRCAREGEAVLAGQDAARLNLPARLWTEIERDHGADRARHAGDALVREPPLDLSLRDPATQAEWARRLAAAALPTGGLRRAFGGAIEELDGFAEGAWWVQDAAASLPALVLGPVRDRKVLDLCAAPGGKTAQLCAAGARVTAVDRSASRLGRLRANLDRLGLGAEIVEADATQFGSPASYDAILLDAPCSATGTLRRHPDLVHLRRSGSAPMRIALQQALLTRAVELLRPGGLLVYATCAFATEEGEGQIERLLGADGRVRRRPITPAEVFGLAEIITCAGDIRTLPGHFAEHGGLDGFHISRLERIS